MLASAAEFSWLRNARFDRFFLGFPLAIGLISALVCLMHPTWLVPILMVDLWLLGYHHVISTYTRIGFDRTSIREHRFLVFVLPFLVLALTLSLYFGIGAWAIATLYLYWQWFHYTRQSYGISRHYFFRQKSKNITYATINTLALYAVPVVGILYRSWQAPEKFLFMDVKVLPVSYELLVGAGIAATVLILMQLLHWYGLFRKGALSGSYVLYFLSHHFIFALGYLLIEDINIGWLAINMWHNAQYILFVWHKNTQTYSQGVDPNHRLISRLSQPGKAVQYFAVCLGITFLFYMTVLIIGRTAESYSPVAAVLIAFMTLNFHHYVVDAVIWKRKKRVA